MNLELLNVELDENFDKCTILRTIFFIEYLFLGYTVIYFKPPLISTKLFWFYFIFFNLKPWLQSTMTETERWERRHMVKEWASAPQRGNGDCVCIIWTTCRTPPQDMALFCSIRRQCSYGVTPINFLSPKNKKWLLEFWIPAFTSTIVIIIIIILYPWVFKSAYTYLD